jgi:hypothetical protein
MQHISALSHFKDNLDFRDTVVINKQNVVYVPKEPHYLLII